MSLPYREQRQLRGIEAGLFWSDSHLAGMLGMFGRLYHGQDMPASEQVPSGHGRGRRGITRIAMAFPSPLSLSASCSARLSPWPPQYGAPASGHRPPRPSAPGQAGKPTASRTLPDRIASRPIGGP
jgi:hypothetical protein